jgi:hypothetical protein
MVSGRPNLYQLFTNNIGLKITLKLAKLIDRFSINDTLILS